MLIAVNITDIIARLRAKARAAGIDLSQPFFFPPDHPKLSQIITEFEHERDARMVRLRRIKKKWRRHEALTSGQNISLEAERGSAGRMNA